MSYSMLADNAKCTAPGRMDRYGKKVCGKSPAYPKTTQQMVGTRPPPGGWTPQPVWLCEEHWPDYVEIGGVSGDVLTKRRFPGMRLGG